MRLPCGHVRPPHGTNHPVTSKIRSAIGPPPSIGPRSKQVAGVYETDDVVIRVIGEYTEFGTAPVNSVKFTEDELVGCWHPETRAKPARSASTTVGSSMGMVAVSGSAFGSSGALDADEVSGSREERLAETGIHMSELTFADRHGVGGALHVRVVAAEREQVLPHLLEDACDGL